METVKRGAGRPTHTARTAKHAQRTPLPPKAGSAGAEAIAEAKARDLSTFAGVQLEGDQRRYGVMTVAELRKVAKSLGVEGYSRMVKGALLTAIVEAETAAAKIKADGRDRAAEAFTVAEKSGTEASRAADRIGEPIARIMNEADSARLDKGLIDGVHPSRVRAAARKAKAETEATPVEPNKIDSQRQADLAKMAEAAPQTKSWQKALAFRGSVAALGWSTSCGFAPDGVDEDIVEVTASRGDEHLWISWTAGAMTLQPMPSYTISDRTIKLKNASACLKYADRPAAAAQEELGKVVSNKAFRRKTVAPKKSRIPFDVGLATDEEVITALAGHTVDWYNSISGAMESGTLGRDAHRVTIQAIDGGDRIVKFCCRATGFRAFRLSALTRVGGYSKTVQHTGERAGEES